MKKELTIILSMNLLIGGYLIWHAGISMSRPYALESDFKAFASRVAVDDRAAHVLEYGGEDDSKDFLFLVDQISDLGKGWGQVSNAGFIMMVSSVLGLVVLSRRKRKV